MCGRRVPVSHSREGGEADEEVVVADETAWGSTQHVRTRWHSSVAALINIMAWVDPVMQINTKKFQGG